MFQATLDQRTSSNRDSSDSRKNSSVRFSEEQNAEAVFGTATKIPTANANARGAMHIEVMQDASRRHKVEDLRDAILDEQIEHWASSFGGLSLEEDDHNLPLLHSNNNLADKKLAYLSWQYSSRDVTEALVSASELECSLH
jgi:hypothetical protein